MNNPCARDAENDIDSVQSTMLVSSDLNGYPESWCLQGFAENLVRIGYALDITTEHSYQSKYSLHLEQHWHHQQLQHTAPRH